MQPPSPVNLARTLLTKRTSAAAWPVDFAIESSLLKLLQVQYAACCINYYENLLNAKLLLLKYLHSAGA